MIFTEVPIEDFSDLANPGRVSASGRKSFHNKLPDGLYASISLRYTVPSPRHLNLAFETIASERTLSIVMFSLRFIRPDDRFVIKMRRGCNLGLL
jgi:hypothetical protein